MRGSLRKFKRKNYSPRETPHPDRIFDAIRPLPQEERWTVGAAATFNAMPPRCTRAAKASHFRAARDYFRTRAALKVSSLVTAEQRQHGLAIEAGASLAIGV